MHFQKGKVRDVLKEVGSRPEGLSAAEAAERLLKNGRNETERQKSPSFIKRFLAQFSDRMIIILLAASAVSFGVSVATGEGGIDSLIILLIVMVNALVGVIQESRAEKAIDALKSLSAPQCTVIRDGEKQNIAAAELVVGDVVLLDKGDFVPADGRLIESEGLTVDESVLTGESEGAFKDARATVAEDAHLAEMRNCVFASTAVIGGHGRFVVTAAGGDTCVGRIAAMLSYTAREQTPLQKRLAKTGSLLGNAALMICGLIFLFALIKGMPPIDTFMTSVSLAVAAIPEGLPAIVTIVLSIGVQRLAERRAVVKRLPAVETLGCVGVICTDKTGTLTQNRMSVTKTMGSGILPLLAAMCNNDDSPTENALMAYALREGKVQEAARHQRVREIPFSSKTKLMVTAHRFGDGYRVVVKGAPDVILSLCENSAEALGRAEEMAGEALRVIGFAYADCNALPRDLLEGGLRFSFGGLAGISDPPRTEAAEAVKLCKKAGIKVVMITGDHKSTAIAIAKKVGIYADGDCAYTEKEIYALAEKKRAAAIRKSTVFARATPEFKVSIVEAFKEAGQVVAMTGDGVNDAPALKRADIGCAMGRCGTDVAREAADLVLTDDNFATVMEAVRHGRGIYENIKRSVRFLLSCNIGEILTVLAAMLAGLGSPLSAIQLLWVNLVTDSLPAISLGLEKTDSRVMGRPPVKKNAPLFDGSAWLKILLEGLFIGAISFSAYNVGVRYYCDPKLGSTMAFTVLSLSQLVHSFNMRSDLPMIKKHPLGNGYLCASFIFCAALQLSTVMLEGARQVFGTAALNVEQWIFVGVLSFMPLLVSDIYKLFVFYCFNKRNCSV